MQFKNRGFTLLEILVALVIMAIISVILIVALHSVTMSKDRISQSSDRLAATQIAMSIMANDLQQIINRSIYDNSGQILSPVLLNTGNTEELEFTRAGNVNPLSQAQRSTLQRVSYRLNKGNLERGTWQVLDRADNTQPNYQIILTNVSNLKWQFLGPNNTVVPVWPSPQISASTPIPRAIEFELDIPNWGTLHRWFMVQSYQMVNSSYAQ